MIPMKLKSSNTGDPPFRGDQGRGVKPGKDRPSRALSPGERSSNANPEKKGSENFGRFIP